MNPADYLLDLVCTTPADGDDDQRLDGIGMGQHMASTYRGSEWAIATEKTINEILADLKRNQYEAPMPRRSTGPSSCMCRLRLRQKVLCTSALIVLLLSSLLLLLLWFHLISTCSHNQV